MMPAKGSAMRHRPKAIRIPRVCAKCGRRLTNAERRDGMAHVRQGRVLAIICQNCLTPANMAEMIIRESTEECGYNVRDELLYKREIGSEDDDAWRLAGSS
jgi:hypothetical protein